MVRMPLPAAARMPAAMAAPTVCSLVPSITTRSTTTLRIATRIAPRAELAARLTRRRDHYMPVSLLDSQLAALEPPAPDEHAIVLDGEVQTHAQVLAVLAALDRQPKG